jgi:hypothetical protein
MVTYVVDYTDSDKLPINVEEREVVRDTPIAIFGRRKLKYGEEMNENLLHILENFACPSKVIYVDTVPYTVPNTDIALVSTLTNAIEGQLWYNSSNLRMYKKVGPDPHEWKALGDIDDISVVSGSMEHGQALPLPISRSNYEYTVAECYWIVSPRYYTDEVDRMECHVDIINEIPTVWMKWWIGAIEVQGHVNYKVIGIKSSV